MDADRARLIERIMKLLALAAGTSFEAEAATARTLAAELMAKHNIDSVDSPKDRSIMVSEDYEPHFKGAMWEWSLAEAAAKLCGCKAYWRGEYAKFIFAGVVPNVEACASTF
jgi:hypothetical protein